MPGFVADASATLPWCFEDEATPATEALLERLREGSTAVVPAHWSTEVMNGLVMAVRRSRIDFERVARFARDLAALPIRIEPPHAPAAWEAVIRVATRHQLTLRCRLSGLAERTSLPLATLDGGLRKAALVRTSHNPPDDVARAPTRAALAPAVSRLFSTLCRAATQRRRPSVARSGDAARRVRAPQHCPKSLVRNAG